MTTRVNIARPSHVDDRFYDGFHGATDDERDDDDGGGAHATSSPGADETIAELYDLGDLCDGTVTCQGTEFPVSRMLLAAASPFFRAG